MAGNSIDGLPHFARGEVVRGFGRGSKELGCPTANLPLEVVKNLPEKIETGVYCGFASVEGGQVHKMVMSVGWNPFYNNETKTVEVHIMHKFDSDFYGKDVRIVILDYLRQEKNFESLDALNEAIKSDIRQAKEKLELPEFSQYKTHQFFTGP
ncbi:riboflavin kinase-like isoform X2 [Diabrotica virgifera virgifera]|nr:riboflavin kinase-like isoform X2 [Diabrotica virgifera virgifera]